MRTALHSAVAALGLALFNLPVVTAQAQFNYTANSGTITITGYTGPGGAVTIPDTVDALPVTTIGYYAFDSCSSITDVTIPRGITLIQPGAFGRCSGLTAITVDPLNPAYGSLAGVLCTKDQTTLIQYPGGKAGTYIIPNSVTSIGDSAFEACANLTGVTIPESVTNIGHYAFFICTSLANVTIPRNVASIGSGAFEACRKLGAITVDPLNPAYSSLAGVLFNKNQTTLIQCPGAKAGSYAVPNTVTNIGDLSFHGCALLTSVAIPNGVTRIGDVAFESCSSLVGITIADTVASIGDMAFDGCNLSNITIPRGVTNLGIAPFFWGGPLAEIAVDPLNPAYCSVAGVVFNKNQTAIIQYPPGKAGSYTVPNTVTNIAAYAFAASQQLTNVIIGNSVTTLDDWAFFDCHGLTRVVLPSGSVTTIGMGAFDGCTLLTAITFPSSLSNIGSYAFSWCTSLIGAYFEGNAPGGDSSVFDGDNNATVYYLPGTTGWGATFGGRPTAPWVPLVLTSDASFGVKTNQFGFNINWASGKTVVVEAATSLANPVWVPLRTNTLIGGLAYFSDPTWTSYPRRFYRIRSP
ncbi:MAG TPA: leucine-rich repeat domain-containing protein [Verrucomicrobiae bacterium]